MGVWQAALTLRQLGDADEPPAKGCWVGVGGKGYAALECSFALQAHALQIFGTYKRVAT